MQISYPCNSLSDMELVVYSSRPGPTSHYSSSHVYSVGSEEATDADGR